MERRHFGPGRREVPVIGQGTWYIEDGERRTVVAALRVAQSLDLAGPVVAVLADSWDRYFTKPWIEKMTTNDP